MILSEESLEIQPWLSAAGAPQGLQKKWNTKIVALVFTPQYYSKIFYISSKLLED